MSEVYIDGVNVAECKNFIPVYTEDEDIEINNCCTLTYTPCQFEKKDCYFKQLQRAKAENEKLKATIKLYGEINENDTAYNAVLLKENRELKIKNNELLTRLSEKYGVFK